ncbi:MAG: DUF485 domain-containing protein [Aliidongia sp.]
MNKKISNKSDRHGGKMAADFSAAHGGRSVQPTADQIIRVLIKKKFQVVGAMTVVYMTSYVGLMLLAGFSRPFLSRLVFGSVNIGFVLITANYLLSWVLALIYVKIANSSFDPLVARAIAAAKSRGDA